MDHSDTDSAYAHLDRDSQPHQLAVKLRPAIIASALLIAGCAPSPPQAVANQGQPKAATTAVPSEQVQATEPAQPQTAATLAQFALPQAGPNPVSAWRPPPYSAPLALRPEDHFYFSRPIPSGAVNWPNPRYRYGSTLFGEEAIHTGVDLGADRGTDVVAAGDGEVVWVGYGLYRGLYDPEDPYGLAIAIRHDFGYLDQALYTVYAHLESISVWLGQRVRAGDRIGSVGSTGHASGPHLHFEVRLGENRYFATRNPELWTVPAEGWGVLAGRVVDTIGNPLPEFLVQIKSVETDQIWEVWTYALGTVKPDEKYEESFVISDLPAGPYQVQINYLGRPYTAFLFVYAGQTNLINFHGREGLRVESDTVTARSESPPSP